MSGIVTEYEAGPPDGGPPDGGQWEKDEDRAGPPDGGWSGFLSTSGWFIFRQDPLKGVKVVSILESVEMYRGIISHLLGLIATTAQTGDPLILGGNGTATLGSTLVRPSLSERKPPTTKTHQTWAPCMNSWNLVLIECAPLRGASNCNIRGLLTLKSPSITSQPSRTDDSSTSQEVHVNTDTVLRSASVAPIASAGKSGCDHPSFHLNTNTPANTEPFSNRREALQRAAANNCMHTHPLTRPPQNVKLNHLNNHEPILAPSHFEVPLHERNKKVPLPCPAQTSTEIQRATISENATCVTLHLRYDSRIFNGTFVKQTQTIYEILGLQLAQPAQDDQLSIHKKTLDLRKFLFRSSGPCIHLDRSPTPLTSTRTHQKQRVHHRYPLVGHPTLCRQTFTPDTKTEITHLKGDQRKKIVPLFQLLRSSSCSRRIHLGRKGGEISSVRNSAPRPTLRASNVLMILSSKMDKVSLRALGRFSSTFLGLMANFHGPDAIDCPIFEAETKKLCDMHLHLDEYYVIQSEKVKPTQNMFYSQFRCFVWIYCVYVCAKLKCLEVILHFKASQSIYCYIVSFGSASLVLVASDSKIFSFARADEHVQVAKLTNSDHPSARTFQSIGLLRITVAVDNLKIDVSQLRKHYNPSFDLQSLLGRRVAC
ncbi:hypothetical protein PROFUN_02089 [Planoprotostelium fungivorum]|uniref:Uncharacterized protein n=1 Tax=Planoprotostelium fungivorum TaxID=1890364 RepID=A0A2P6NBC3_9EUKA|nr:hypothetical protein PROFUN_02089 [Planoprotostelium fungivorum]